MALLPESFDPEESLARLRKGGVGEQIEEVRRLTRSAYRYSWWAIGISLCTLVFSLVVAWIR